MSGSHFYLTLPSNASMDAFPDNKTTGYRVQLPQDVNLEGEWEVGLYSVTYPNTWYTVQRAPPGHFIYYKMPKALFSGVSFQHGHYTSMEDLIKGINTALVATGEVGDNIKLTYNTFTRKVSFEIKNKYELALYKPVSVIMGFGNEEPIIEKTTTAPYVADLTVVSTNLKSLGT